MMKSQMVLLLLAVHYACTVSAYQRDGPEKRLAEDLLDISDTGSLPVRNASTLVIVEFELGLIQIDLSEKENLLRIRGWCRYKWKDEYLQWNPSEYGDIDAVKLPSHRLWRPDVELYNTASLERFEHDVPANVQYDGTVTWRPHRIFESFCSIDVRNFPFDKQTCNLMFGSWTYEKSVMDLTLGSPQGIDLSTLQANSEWDIVRVVAHQLPEEKIGTFAVLKFNLHLERRITLSTCVQTLPLLFISFLTLLVFWLPAKSAHKSTVGLVIFGCLLLFLFFVMEEAPLSASGMSMLGKYYCVTLVIVMLSIFLSSVVSNLETKIHLERPPAWLRKIFFGCLTYMLCMNEPHVEQKPTVDTEEQQNLLACLQSDEEEEHANIAACQQSDRANNEDGSSQMSSEYLANFYNSINILCHTFNKYFVCKVDEDVKDSERKLIKEEWRCVAAILDRLFFFIYLTVILVAMAIMFSL